jgi:hypothetical protein
MSSNGETADTVHNTDKMEQVDYLRLMADNQKTLNTSNADDRQRRGLPPVKEGEVQINVDSPTTVTHNYPAPAPAKGSLGTLGKAAIAAALLGGAGGGLAIPWALGAFKPPDPPPAETRPDEDTKYQFKLQGE